MKKTFLLFLSVAVLSACNTAQNDTESSDSETATTEQQEETSATEETSMEGMKTVEVNVAESNVSWYASKVTGEHTGSVDLQSGELTIEDGELTGGKFVMNMTSIENEDVEDPEYHKKLVNHLKSEDFFFVKKYPEAMFQITNVEKLEGNKENTHKITGDLTIKDKSGEVTFPAKVRMEDDMLKAKATITFDRTNYDIKYRSGKFFEDLGDKLIHDEVKLTVGLKGSVNEEEVASVE